LSSVSNGVNILYIRSKDYQCNSIC
jgi:hypothetical protein